jgi:hypothetical protein
LRQLTRLVVLLLGLAAVSGIENCVGLPLIGEPERLEHLSFAQEVQTKAGHITVKEKDLFYLVSQMLVGSKLEFRFDNYVTFTSEILNLYWSDEQEA